MSYGSTRTADDGAPAVEKLPHNTTQRVGGRRPRMVVFASLCCAATFRSVEKIVSTERATTASIVNVLPLPVDPYAKTVAL